MASPNVSVVPSVPSVLIRTDNLETYSLIWADGSVNSNENRNAQEQLRSAINHIKVFENGNECETYIHQSKDEQILLIISGRLGSVIVPLIHSLRQISSIYVYCLNSNKHREWASKFTKIRVVVTDLNELIEKINIDRTEREKQFKEPLPVSIFNSLSNEERSATNMSGGFLHFQLLIDGLLRLHYNQTNRDEFFELCKKEYEGNNAQLTILREFEESYTPERALHWYTRQSFLYRMLNKALRVQNIYVLFLFGFFIQDIYQQLKKLQQKQDQTSIRVYRGQLMSNQELEILKGCKGHFISMNSLLSTTYDREISLMFVSSEYEDDDLCHVLFEIDVDPLLSSQRKPFANISSQSRFLNEQEILFMIGSIFHLVDIRQENQTTIIQMELCNENYDHDMKSLFEFMRKESEKDNECLVLGHILRDAGMYDKAEQIYNRMLNELTNDHPSIADLWGSIGLVKKAKGEIEISSQWFNKAFKKYKHMGNSLGLARSLQNLANIHHMKGELTQAINKYNQALNIFKEMFGDQNNAVANCVHNLGITYYEQRRFAEAVQCYMNALDIRKRILPQTHHDIATTLSNIGNVYFVMDEYDQALHYFEQALNIFQMSVPSEHPLFARTYHNMGIAYLMKGNSERSLVFLNRAASIYRDKFSADHPDVHGCINIINCIKQGKPQSE